jgi:hypothetical protein
MGNLLSLNPKIHSLPTDAKELSSFTNREWTIVGDCGGVLSRPCDECLLHGCVPRALDIVQCFGSERNLSFAGDELLSSAAVLVTMPRIALRVGFIAGAMLCFLADDFVGVVAAGEGAFSESPVVLEDFLGGIGAKKVGPLPLPPVSVICLPSLFEAEFSIGFSFRQLQRTTVKDLEKMGLKGEFATFFTSDRLRLV